MNNLLSYCGLIDGRISASEKDLAVPILSRETTNFKKNATLEVISPRCGNEFYHAYYSDKHTLCFVNENIFQTRKSNFFKKEKKNSKRFGMNSRLHRYS